MVDAKVAVDAKAARGWVASFVVVAALGLVGCVPSLNGNDAREPNATLPEHVGQGDDAGASAAAEKWLEFFDAPELRALIELALENNQELDIQLQEIIIARSEVDASEGEYLPSVRAEAGAGVEKVGHHTRSGVVDEHLGLPKHLGEFSFGLAASWEVDVWKKLRNAAKAADLRYLATIEGRKFVVTQIVAEIARSYFELIALDREIEVLERNVAIQEDALEVVRLQKEAARVTELAVRRFEAEVLKSRSRLYDLAQQRVFAENRINFLVGRFPQRVARDPKKLDEPLPVHPGAGLPSKLLENRPDVRRARLELEATKLDVEAAKAAFYPSLGIDVGVGYEAFNAAHLIATPASLAYGVLGRLSAPLLNRKAIAAQYRTANARQVQAVLEYERSLLQAFTDVHNQLLALQNLHESYDLQERQVQALTHSVEVSNVLFQSARADYMEVLLTRRDSLDAELELIETKTRQLHALVSLYQALGGGWRSTK